MTVYRIRTDENATDIAALYGISERELKNLNEGVDLDQVKAGAEIAVPASSRTFGRATPRAARNFKNAWEHFSPETIAAACDASVSSIQNNWPHIHWALDELGIAGQRTQAAAIATVKLEVGRNFEPINEYYSHYWDTYSGGPRYHGRGYIQLTHDYNYQKYGELIGVDLVNDPDRALEASISAWVLAYYFRDRGTSAAAERCDWRRVRITVLGKDQPGAIAAIVRELGVNC
jgi:predicted chitinase